MNYRVDTGIKRRPSWMSSDSSAPVEGGGAEAKKSIGEVAPVREKLEDHPDLEHFFAHYGSLEKKKRKLKNLTGKDAKLVLARGTVASVDEKANLYFGVEFLEEHGHNDDLIMAVMAHEYGHLISDFNEIKDVDALSWAQIFELRRQEEGAADGLCGRMLAMLDVSPEALKRFLKDSEKGSKSVKYYSAQIRATIIQEAYDLQKQRKQTSKKIFAEKSIYHNPYLSKLMNTE